MALASIILINFNGLRDLEACLESLAAQDHEAVELVAIDNASTDGSLEILREFASREENARRFTGLRIMENRENTGFSPALNQGIREASGELLMPLNTDVVMEPGFVKGLVSCFDDVRVGSATGKLLRFPPGGGDNVVDSAGHLIFRNRLAENRGEGLPAGSFNEPGTVFGTCGAAALYSRKMLEDVAVDGEYFDEDFFAFWEDVDLDWRANMRGWRCAYTPEAVAYHRRGGAGYRKSLLVEYHNYKNRYLMMLKNDSARYIVRNLPGLVLTEVLKAGALLIRCPRALLSIVEVIRLAPKMLRKRRVIQGRRIVPARELESWFLPFDYAKWVRRHLLNRGEMIVEAAEDEC